jgi:hypothetical protein
MVQDTIVVVLCSNVEKCVLVRIGAGVISLVSEKQLNTIDCVLRRSASKHEWGISSIFLLVLSSASDIVLLFSDNCVDGGTAHLAEAVAQTLILTPEACSSNSIRVYTVLSLFGKTNWSSFTQLAPSFLQSLQNLTCSIASSLDNIWSLPVLLTISDLIIVKLLEVIRW